MGQAPFGYTYGDLRQSQGGHHLRTRERTASVATARVDVPLNGQTVAINSRFQIEALDGRGSVVDVGCSSIPAGLGAGARHTSRSATRPWGYARAWRRAGSRAVRGRHHGRAGGGDGVGDPAALTKIDFVTTEPVAWTCDGRRAARRWTDRATGREPAGRQYGEGDRVRAPAEILLQLTLEPEVTGLRGVGARLPAAAVRIVVAGAEGVLATETPRCGPPWISAAWRRASTP